MSKSNRLKIALSLFLDLLIIALIGVWLVGGVPWNDKILLKYGADSRRTALTLIIIIWLAWPFFRQKSFVLKAINKVKRILLIRRSRWSVILLFCLFSMVLAALQATALRYPMYDVGLFHQILWGLANGHGFVSTISKAGNFLSDHSSVSLVLLTPFYWVFKNSAVILPIIHVVLVYLGISAWVFLAEKAPSTSSQTRSTLAATTTVFALCFDSLWANQRWGFHENAIAFAAYSWSLALIFADLRWNVTRTVSIFILLLIAAGAKEVLLLDISVAFIALSLVLAKIYSGRSRIFSTALTATTTIVLILLFIGFESLPHPADKNYFERYYSYLGSGLGELLEVILVSPGKVIEAIGAVELLKYFYTVFVPWLGLPLLWFYWAVKNRGIEKRAALTYLLIFASIFPSFLSAALSTYSPLRQDGFHYVLELWPALAVLTIIAISKLKYAHPIAWSWALLSLLLLGQDPFAQIREYGNQTSETSEVRSIFQSIPKNMSVAAHEMTGVMLAGRPLITKWPNTDFHLNSCPDLVVLPAHENIGKQNTRCKHSLIWSKGGWNGYLSNSFRRVRSAQKGP